MGHTYTGKITTVKSLPTKAWTTILRAPMPRSPFVLALFYVRVDYELADGATYGWAEIRVLRPDGDDTMVDGIFLPAPDPAKPGGKGTRGVTRLWWGAGISYLDLQVRPGQGVKSVTTTAGRAPLWTSVKARYGKGIGLS